MEILSGFLNVSWVGLFVSTKLRIDIGPIHYLHHLKAESLLIFSRQLKKFLNINRKQA